MKRRSLSLFLAILMAFGSVLPVFATEPTETTTTATEEQTSTKTEAEAFADMYVDRGLVFRWDAYTMSAFEGNTLLDADGRDATAALVGLFTGSTTSFGVDKRGVPYVKTDAALKIDA